MDELVDMMETSNVRIEAQQINVNMAKLIEELINFMDFDAIDYDDLDEAMTRTFIILKVVDVFDNCDDFDYASLYPSIKLVIQKNYLKVA